MVTNKGNKWVFRFTSNNDIDGELMAKYLVPKLGFKKSAYLAVNNDWGRSMAKAVSAIMKKTGGKVITVEYCAGNETNFTPLLTRIKNSGADSLFITTSYTGISLIMKQYHELGMKMPVFITSGLSAERLMKIAGPKAMEGVYFFERYVPGSPPPSMKKQNKALIAAYKKLKPKEEADMYLVFGYDAVHIMGRRHQPRRQFELHGHPRRPGQDRLPGAQRPGEVRQKRTLPAPVRHQPHRQRGQQGRLSVERVIQAFFGEGRQAPRLIQEPPCMKRNHSQGLELPARPEPVEIIPERTAFLITDMQNSFCRPGGLFQQNGVDISGAVPVIKTIARLKEELQDCGMAFIYLQHTYRPDLLDGGGAFSPNRVKAPSLRTMEARPELRGRFLVEGSWDWQIVDELTPGPGDMVIKKQRYSGFCGTILDNYLRSLGITHLLFTGVATNICVESTAREAFFREYWPILIEDGMNHAGPDFNRQATMWIMENHFGWVTSSQEVIKTFAAAA